MFWPHFLITYSSASRAVKISLYPAILIRGDERVGAAVHKVVPVDATGAGDQFAAGLIHGLALGAPLEVAGRMGCIAAAEVISHVGPRPERDIRAQFRAEGLI